MTKIEKKAVAFVAALADIYRDEEDRELVAVKKMEFSDDITEDFTAMLIAMQLLFSRITGDDCSDIIDFTHILNKLAIQYVMHGDGQA